MHVIFTIIYRKIIEYVIDMLQKLHSGLILSKVHLHSLALMLVFTEHYRELY